MAGPEHWARLNAVRQRKCRSFARWFWPAITFTGEFFKPEMMWEASQALAPPPSAVPTGLAARTSSPWQLTELARRGPPRCPSHPRARSCHPRALPGAAQPPQEPRALQRHDGPHPARALRQDARALAAPRRALRHAAPQAPCRGTAAGPPASSRAPSQMHRVVQYDGVTALGVL